MKNPAVAIGVVVIVNACLWGLAMIMSAKRLSGTGGYQEIQSILAGCAGASLIVVGGGLAGLAKKPKQGE